jgi:excisionase family DNA binding protein
MNQQFMTVTETAKALGLTGRTVLRYIHKGVFPGAYQLPGGDNMPWLIPVEAVKNFTKPERKK